MSSFNRADYLRVHKFAANVYRDTSIDDELRLAAIEIMDLVERCVGQLMDRPDKEGSPTYLGWSLPSRSPIRTRFHIAERYS